jgi:hypothetical protein
VYKTEQLFPSPLVRVFCGNPAVAPAEVPHNSRRIPAGIQFQSAFTPMTKPPKRTFSANYANSVTVFGNALLVMVDLFSTANIILVK